MISLRPLVIVSLVLAWCAGMALVPRFEVGGLACGSPLAPASHDEALERADSADLDDDLYNALAYAETPSLMPERASTHEQLAEKVEGCKGGRDLRLGIGVGFITAAMAVGALALGTHLRQ